LDKEGSVVWLLEQERDLAIQQFDGPLHPFSMSAPAVEPGEAPLNAP
jgi:hypothetical protein